MHDLWNELASRASLTLSADQHDAMERYLDLLVEVNARMNLTRITDRESARVLHIADALTLLAFLPRGAHRLADVGSGGGVPGIPLAIARPDARVALIESTQKKAAFLEETARALNLSNVRVLPVRAEDAARGAERESFDVVTARAVGALDTLLEWCMPLLRTRGRVLAMKGQKAAAEIPEAAKIARLLGGGPIITHPTPLSGAEHHVIVEVAKISRTNDRYPRLAVRPPRRPGR
jgi:16S rRNA (guanine527-N7)-methyltransferase